VRHPTQLTAHGGDRKSEVVIKQPDPNGTLMAQCDPNGALMALDPNGTL